MTTMFRGATAVRAAVGDYLTFWVPKMIEVARVDWNLTEQQLPMPEGYDAYEPYALDKWPLLGINVVQAGTFDRQAYGPTTEQEYLAEYTVRVFTWVRTPMDSAGTPLEPEYSESIRLRDDLAACVRASILRSGCFGQPNAILFNESTLNEEYSEATGVKGDRFVSGVIHSFEIRFDESVPLVPIGTADTLSMIVQTIAETEAEEEAGP
jgi:hypothetical protein